MIIFTRKDLIANTFLNDEKIEQILDYQKITKAVENRLEMAKTLKDDYMTQLFTDILREAHAEPR